MASETTEGKKKPGATKKFEDAILTLEIYKRDIKAGRNLAKKAHPSGTFFRDMR